MQLPNSKQIKADAARALSRGREPKKLILAYSGSTAGLIALVTVLSLWLSRQIEGTSGLSGMAARTVLSTVQTLLPMAQSLILSCLSLGYLGGMVRICRGQYADHTDLKVGFRKFFPLLRLMFLQSGIVLSTAFLTCQLASSLYMFTPWAEDFMAVLEATGVTSVDMMNEEFMVQAAASVLPMLVIWAVLLLLVMVPLSYRLRMSQYALLDDPRGGALRAIAASMKMTRKNCFRLFKLDLSYWWYYLLEALAVALSYLNLWLPLDETVGYLLSSALYLAALFALYYFLLNRVQAGYTMAYESLRDKPINDGVVLGNIFDM